jgi:hypothetical protein
MDATYDLPLSQSSPTSFHTVQEFRSPASLPSWSDFAGFSDDDNGPLRNSSPSSYTDLLSIPATSLTAPPTCYPDGSIRSFTSLDDGVSFCQSWARDHGYAVRKCRNKSRGKEKVIYTYLLVLITPNLLPNLSVYVG